MASMPTGGDNVGRCRAGLKKLWLICWLQLHPLEYRVSQQQPPTAAFPIGIDEPKG